LKTYSSLKVERTILVGFLSLILIGTLLIWSFNCSEGKPISLIDAMFTATSAVCVTGLAVVKTGRDLVPMSQGVLLVLIQLGGLGVMTAATALLILMRQRIGIRQRLLFAGGMGMDSPAGAIRLLYRILKITLAIESVGAIPLFWGFYGDIPVGKSLYFAVFHSISAFCNAGFSPISTSLEAYSGNIAVSGTVMVLIVIGGIGYLPLINFLAYLKRKEKLRVHTRLVFSTSAILIMSGFVLLLVSEWGNGLASLNWKWKIWNALFQSVTPRTAGFNTIPISTFSSLGVLILCILMIIGASPGSTGGGVKTTTFAVLSISAWNFMRGRNNTVIWNRSIHDRDTLRALTITAMYICTIFFATFILSTMEPFPFKSVLFEVISALGTVGLSMGITAQLSTGAKFILILLMFWGRVGLLTFIYGTLTKDSNSRISYARANIPVG